MVLRCYGNNCLHMFSISTDPKLLKLLASPAVATHREKPH